MLSVDHFRRFVVMPTLKGMLASMDSPAAVELLVGTALVESRLEKLKQGLKKPGDGLGVALGVYQIEPRTYRDLFMNFLPYRPELRSGLLLQEPKPETSLITDLAYATKIARLIYYRSPKRLPAADDIQGLAAMWKAVYNTPLGAGDPDDFVRVYNQFGRP